jgi:hypothetical protein
LTSFSELFFYFCQIRITYENQPLIAQKDFFEIELPVVSRQTNYHWYPQQFAGPGYIQRLPLPRLSSTGNA